MSETLEDAATWCRRDGEIYWTLRPAISSVGRGGGPTFVVEADFPFNVSIPWWLRWAVDRHDPRYLKAARDHDWTLNDGWDVWAAGAQFRSRLEENGVHPIQRLLMTLAVIAFARRG